MQFARQNKTKEGKKLKSFPSLPELQNLFVMQFAICNSEVNFTEDDYVLYHASIVYANKREKYDFYAYLTNETESSDFLGKIIHIAPIPDDMPYGIYTWTVSATNNASMEVTSNSETFVVCDYPKPVELENPVSDANTSNEIVFEWKYESVFYGSPCTFDIKDNRTLTIYVEDNETGEVVYTHKINPDSKTSKWDASEDLKPSIGFRPEHDYIWYMVISNNEMSVKSEERTIHVTKMTCQLLDCQNGGRCETNDTSGEVLCICIEGYTGRNCSDGDGNVVNVPLIVGSVLGAFFAVVIIISIIVFVLIRKRKREERQRVTLKGPVKDLRFTNVKLKNGQGDIDGSSSSEINDLKARLKDDAENGGFAFSIAILASTPSTDIENTCKALLYAHHHDHNDVAFMKALIRREVSTSVKADVIFRANTAATLTFKHLSKMVGLNYLFATLGKVIRDVIQKDADDTAVEERMKNDKNLSELLVMQDTCEVDPTKLNDQSGDDLISVNSIQLTLLVQRFAKHIFQSADKMPPEIHEVMVEVRDSVSLMFPEAVQCALSAFLFLRFFNCGIAVPESYGLLEEPPNERIRRSLVLATKILTTMTSGAHFGDKEQFMIQFNELIDKNVKPLKAFYDAVCSDSPTSSGTSEFMDTPYDIYLNSLNVIAHYEKCLNGTAILS